MKRNIHLFNYFIVFLGSLCFSINIAAQNYVYTAQFGGSGTGNGQFQYPTGVAIDASGNIFVADLNNHRIQKFSSTGTYLLNWGTNGTGNGQFNYAYSVRVDASGNVYVADLGNNRIQKFNNNGGYLLQWGSQGSGNGQFTSPSGVAIDAAGNVYVVDAGNNRIQKFNSSGTYLSQWGGPGTGNGQFNGPREVAIDAAGNVFVGDQGNYRIQKFTNAGVYITHWGSLGNGNGQFSKNNSPFGVAIDASNNVYVADRDNNRIQKFTNTGAFISQWGSRGNGNGQFIYPTGVAIDAFGNVFVADQINTNIQKFVLLGFPTITFSGITKTYGDAPFQLNAVSDSPGAFTYFIKGSTLPASVNGNTITILNSGVTTITAIQAAIGDWKSATVTSTLTVNKATLNIIAQNKYKLPNEVNPALTYTATGFKNTDNISILSGTPTLSTTGVQSSPKGNYPITITKGTLSNLSNYDFAFQNGALEVGAPQTINFSTLPSKKYGDANFTISATATSNLPVTFTSSNQNVAQIVGNEVRIVGAGSTNITANQPGDNTTYSAAPAVTQQLIVNKATLTITASNISVAKGTITIPYNYSVVGFKNTDLSSEIIGAPTYQVVPSAISNPGFYTITITQGSLSSSKYDFVFVNGRLSVYYLASDLVDGNNTILPTSSKQSEGLTVRLGVLNSQKAIGAEVKFRPFTSKTWQTVAATKANNVYSYTFSAEEIGELGMEYYFVIKTDIGVDVIYNTTQLTKVYDVKTEVSNLNFGFTQNDYNIISIPFDLGAKNLVTDVFLENLSTYDIKKWRLLRFNTLSQQVEEYQKTDFNNIELGRGYWLIIKTKATFNAPAAKPAQATPNNPFEISLKTGWNVIGNPYLFNVAWKDVQDYNGFTGNLITWDKGFSIATVLPKFKGGYVYSANNITIRIPTYKNDLLNQRKAVEPFNGWRLSLDLNKPAVANHSIYSIGMSQDENGILEIPSLLSPIDETKLKINGQNMASIVPANDTYTWNLFISTKSNEATVLNWNEIETDKDLFLVIPTSGTIVNMKENKNCSFNGEKTFKVVYGNIEDAKKALLVQMQDYMLSPNPTIGKIEIKSTNVFEDVQIELVDMIGNIVLKSSYFFKEEKLNLDVSNIPPGVYQAIFSTSQGTKIKKIIKY